MSREQRTPSLTFVLFLWLTPQLISLALSAMRVPLLSVIKMFGLSRLQVLPKLDERSPSNVLATTG